MTAREAAFYLRSSTSDLAKLRHFGGGPLFIKKSARKILYRRTDLDAWVAGRTFTSTTAADTGTVAKVAA